MPNFNIKLNCFDFVENLLLCPLSQLWDHARQNDEQAEISFCEYKGINMSTLRVTWDAKNQLQDIMTNVGFPEETLLPITMDTIGTDPKLDTIMALMCYGLYPNVCYHKEKRKVCNF